MRIIIHCVNNKMKVLDSIEGTLPGKKIDCFGKEGLLMNSWPYLLLPLIIFISTQVVWDNAWVIMIIIYAILPLVDELFSQDKVNPS